MVSDGMSHREILDARPDLETDGRSLMLAGL
jgi:hypothetical protein